MMHARPYDDSERANDVDALFLSELEEIRRSRPGIESRLAAHPSSAPVISARMRDVRALPLIERRSIYLDERVREQRQWYSRKSAHNGRRAIQMLGASIVLDLIAVVVAILQATSLLGTAALYGFIATLGASILTWSRLKRYRDLASSYQLAAQELASLSELVAAADTEERIRDLVEQTEGAISREHTMWYAKYSEAAL